MSLRPRAFTKSRDGGLPFPKYSISFSIQIPQILPLLLHSFVTSSSSPRSLLLVWHNIDGEWLSLGAFPVLKPRPWTEVLLWLSLIEVKRSLPHMLISFFPFFPIYLQFTSFESAQRKLPHQKPCSFSVGSVELIHPGVARDSRR